MLIGIAKFTIKFSHNGFYIRRPQTIVPTGGRTVRKLVRAVGSKYRLTIVFAKTAMNVCKTITSGARFLPFASRFYAQTATCAAWELARYIEFSFKSMTPGSAQLVIVVEVDQIGESAD